MKLEFESFEARRNERMEYKMVFNLVSAEFRPLSGMRLVVDFNHDRLSDELDVEAVSVGFYEVGDGVLRDEIIRELESVVSPEVLRLSKLYLDHRDGVLIDSLSENLKDYFERARQST